MKLKELSEIQTANLNLLLLVSEHARTDRAITCCLFGIDIRQAEFFAQLTFNRILTLVCHIDECLFRPRVDITQLFTCPPQLAGTIFTTQQQS
ncbi:MAG: flagellar transcriptional regulator FlhD [Betaproteobacteria bacterium]|nr:flagellar transcriptional regulator FlhD [Betaproteobacteria bacterium]